MVTTVVPWHKIKVPESAPSSYISRNHHGTSLAANMLETIAAANKDKCLFTTKPQKTWTERQWKSGNKFRPTTILRSAFRYLI